MKMLLVGAGAVGESILRILHLRQILGCDDSAAKRVIDVMINIGHPVADFDV
ncbi:hypothetical protein P0G10_20595 [Eubacteriales bacterium DFI.9.88]|nr:hypothetical protein [Eubacteriales bacterium DFI.9.88]